MATDSILLFGRPLSKRSLGFSLGIGTGFLLLLTGWHDRFPNLLSAAVWIVAFNAASAGALRITGLGSLRGIVPGVLSGIVAGIGGLGIAAAVRIPLAGPKPGG